MVSPAVCQQSPADMTANADIWCAANLLVTQHGKDAPWSAAQRVDELLVNGDLLGHEARCKVGKAVDEVRRQKLKEDERINWRWAMI